MAKVYQSATDLIGNTPLLKLNRYSAEAGVKDATILGKLEYLNPAGSVKDIRKCKRPCCILHGKRCRGERSFKGRFRDH